MFQVCVDEGLVSGMTCSSDCECDHVCWEPVYCV